jgi:hypothetical protein
VRARLLDMGSLMIRDQTLWSNSYNDDDDGDDDDDDGDDDNEPVWSTWAVGALFSYVRRIQIVSICGVFSQTSGIEESGCSLKVASCTWDGGSRASAQLILNVP